MVDMFQPGWRPTEVHPLADAATGGRIEFTGVRDPRAGRGYLLLGKVVPV